MKKIFQCVIAVQIFLTFIATTDVLANPGTASASNDSICQSDNTTLILTGYSGSIQWQSFDGSMWINETSPGFNTDMYEVQPGVTTDYRALVTDSVSNTDSSNVVTIFVTVVPPPVVVNGSRCGIGPITLNASGIGLTTWYIDSLTDEPIHEGDTFTSSITQSTTYYVSTVDTTSSGGSGGTGNPVLLGGTFGATNGSTENGFNVINISPSDIQINTINWEWDNIANPATVVDVLINPTGGNVTNATSGAGWVVYESFNFAPNTFGGAGAGTPTTFVNPLIIPAGATVGIAFDVVSGQVTNSYQTGDGTEWVSTEFTDGNLIITEGAAGGPPGGGLGGFQPRNFWGTIEYEFADGFCESARVPITASITPPPAVTINASPSSFVCGADSVTLVPTSSNSAYSYTWTPDPDILSISGDTAFTFVGTSNTFYVLADDGTCVSLDSILVDVGAATTAGVATVATDSICAGYTIPLNLSGSAGVINWQHNTGSGWITPGTPASMMPEYMVTPMESTLYRAVLTSGGCPSDTSNILSITTSEVSAPTVSDTTLCEGTHLFSAGGSGPIYWYSSPNSITPEATGSATSVSVSADTTFYVSASSGVAFNIGKPANVPGGLGQSLVPGHGIGFDVTETVTIRQVDIYPFSTGLIHIVLRSSAGGPVLHTALANVVSGGNKTSINLGWVVFPGTGYRMEMGPLTSASLIRNTSGAFYPMTSLDSDALQITGFLDPNLNTGPAYSYFYNWQVSDGCESPREALNVTVLPLPAIPVITAVGQVLSSTAATSYQWFLNGNIIPGATMQSHTAIVSGDYTVQVTGANGCTNTSAIFSIVVGLQELSAGTVNIFPNPVQENLFVEYDFKSQTTFKLQLYNSLGELLRDDNEKMLSGQGSVSIDMQAHVPGIYMLILTANDEIRSYKIIR